MLLVASRRGWTAVGIEPNEFAVRNADDVVPGATIRCALEEFAAPNSAFDAISCLDVFEHVRRPNEALFKFRSLLQPGGILAIATVDIGSSAARLLGSRWMHLHRDHLWYFTSKSLRMLVEQCGFRVQFCGAGRKIFNLNYILSILASGACMQPPGTATVARLGLRMLPWRLQTRAFRFHEGLLLIASKIA
jgi:cyclopropane fatty-acyl-phospholipid synthase-like methyltransferase